MVVEKTAITNNTKKVRKKLPKEVKLALDLYLLGEKKSRICKKLNIKMYDLDKWIQGMYNKKVKNPDAEKDLSNPRQGLQKGRSLWVSHIIFTNFKIKVMERNFRSEQ